MKRRYAILTAVLVIALMLSGCSPGSGHNTGSHGSGGGRAEAAGDYYAFVCTAQDGTDCSAKDITLSLNADGTGEFRFPGGSLELRWSVRGTELSFTDEDGVNFSGNCTSGLISGDYRGYEFIFTNDKEYAQSYVSFDDGAPSPVIGQGQMPGSSASAQSLYFTRKTLYEPNYGIKTANALVPYGWSSSVSVQWGLLSTMYPAAATVTMLSPDGRAKIEIMSTVGYLQMARNGSWIPEGTYLDLYNIFLNYRDAAGYNDYILGVLGYTGTVLNREKPDYEFQLALNAEANSFLAAMSTSGITGKECAGSYEKTAYFITGGDAYEAEVVSTVIMARTINGLFDTYTWTVPITAVFTAYDEEAYAAYADAFTLTVANTSFCGQFLYVVQRNAQYLNEMMHDYLMESVYKPSSSDISGWAGDYSESQQDKWVNAWCDVITERDEYVTSDGSSVKIPTMYDAVYQNGDTIYMGPQADLGSDWQQLSVKPYMQ